MAGAAGSEDTQNSARKTLEEWSPFLFPHERGIKGDGMVHIKSL
jgi:hypothetical protein